MFDKEKEKQLKVEVQYEEPNKNDEDAVLSDDMATQVTGGACLNNKDSSDVWEP